MLKNGHSPPIEVIATTISGSISDWSKVERIVPLFAAHGWSDVTMHAVDSHAEARQRASELVASGAILPTARLTWSPAAALSFRAAAVSSVSDFCRVRSRVSSGSVAGIAPWRAAARASSRA